MNQPPSRERAEFVSANDSGRLLAVAARSAADSAAGIFGPGSISWKINRESAVFLGAGRAALLQLAHPWVAAALADHSTVLDQPIARFHNTFRIVFTMIFGTLDQALAAARYLYTLHTRIRGELDENVAGWERGAHYEANEINALRWVYATLVESAVLAYECAIGPMTATDREQYYAESKTLAGLFGLPADTLPETWETFMAYNRAMQASDALGVSREARAIAHRLLSGSGSWIHPPKWYRALTTAWMPERFREEFGLSFNAEDRRAVESTMRRLPWIYRFIPPPMRFSGPWQEARARLAGRHTGLLTHWSNRFWIGVPRMPFASSAMVRN